MSGGGGHGAGAWENRGEGYGDRRRKGGKWERNSKRQALVIYHCLSYPVKETNSTMFLDFHLMFSQA